MAQATRLGKGEAAMYNIRPISDLRTKLNEIENSVDRGDAVFLTKNGYGRMVVLSLDRYSELTDRVELLLDEADIAAEATEIRYTLDETTAMARGVLNGR